jgi:hypothetical protein
MSTQLGRLEVARARPPACSPGQRGRAVPRAGAASHPSRAASNSTAGHEDRAEAGPPLSTASRKERDTMSPIALELAGHSPTASEVGTRLGAQNTSPHTSVLWRFLRSEPSAPCLPRLSCNLRKSCVRHLTSGRAVCQKSQRVAVHRSVHRVVHPPVHRAVRCCISRCNDVPSQPSFSSTRLVARLNHLLILGPHTLDLIEPRGQAALMGWLPEACRPSACT